VQQKACAWILERSLLMTKCSENITVSNNIGLAHLCAKKFVGKGIEYEDLFQAGSLGLVKAIKRFDSDRGVKFSTYAVPVILGEIRLLFRDGGAIKVSRHLRSLSIKISKQRELFLAKTGQEPSLTELSKVLKVDIETITEAVDSSITLISLTSDEKNGGHQIDIPTDPIEEKLTDHLSLKEAIKRLGCFDRRLVTLRFFKKRTQSETAQILGASQSQISRREKIVLAKLRKNLV
jgi:RNA polymerase sporulation-specific sigma factor